MAINFPGAKFFSTADTKSRIFIVFAVVGLVSALVFFTIKFFGGGSSVGGGSKVASAPTGLQSVPGGKTSTEYAQALMQANIQAAEQARMTGGSAVPTLINVQGPQPTFSQPASTNCTVVCPGEDAANVATDIASMVKQNKLAQDAANTLLNTAKNNVPPSEYAALLDSLVKAGKLTPDQARQLLAQYKKQHDNAAVMQSARIMDGLIKSGQLSVETANSLLALQKNKIAPEDYAAEINRLVTAGKIPPQLGSQLIAQYSQQKIQQAKKECIFSLKQMARAGAITNEVGEALAQVQDRNAPVDQYAAELQRFVAAGKLTPEVAGKLLEQYKRQCTSTSNTSALESFVAQKQAEANADLDAMVKRGEMSQQVSDILKDLQNKNVSPEDYQKMLDELVRQGKLSPEMAKSLMAKYNKLYGAKAEASQLAKLQGNNASAGAYSEELKRAVQAGLISPAEAASLMQAYQQSIMPSTLTTPAADVSLPGGGLAELQQRLQQQQAVNAAPTTTPAAQDFAATAVQAQQDERQARLQRVQQMSQAMSGQAQSLLTAWQPPKMQHVEGSPPAKDTKEGLSSLAGAGTSTVAKKGQGLFSGAESGPILIKSGTILFAVLDTAVDSDYPDTPAMATIVEGPFKGAKLLGKIAVVQGQDKLSLTFNLMNKDDWLKSKSVNAFAVDPDTARTVMASSVDHHYFMRYGGMFAASFLTGYSSAITNAGNSTTGIFGTSTTHPNLSPGNRIAVGLGQVGTAFSNVVQTYVNTPTTVKVNAGVGLGILFMADVT